VTPDEEALARVVLSLDALGIAYMVTGSVASSHHGRPRMTHEVDVVIDPSAEALADVAGVLDVHGKSLDLAYVDRCARELGVADLWQHVARPRGLAPGADPTDREPPDFHDRDEVGLQSSSKIMPGPPPRLGSRFQEALHYASSIHAQQVRKGSQVPYVAHLLAAASLVLEDGGTEDEAIAALLHDAVEDQGGQPRLKDIRNRFGDKVAEIVEGCTDTDAIPKPPWRERKERYVEHVRSAPPDVLRVSCADKLHNARALLADFRALGGALWKRFNGGRDGTLWYYRTLASVYKERRIGFLAEELHRVVSELEHLVVREDVKPDRENLGGASFGSRTEAEHTGEREGQIRHHRMDLLGRKDRHPVEILFEELSKLGPYPNKVVPLWARNLGFSFFPGGSGLWDAKTGEPLPGFPRGEVMILGHNFYSVEGFRKQLFEGKTDDQYQTARNLSRILDDHGIPKEKCFFTNFFMGLSVGGENEGEFPGAEDLDFVERCRDLLRFQLELQQPRLVVVLGRHVPRLVAGTAPALEPWGVCKSLREIDERELALAERVAVEGVDAPFVAAVLTHPCRHVNVRHRRFRGLKGLEAETELLRVAWDAASKLRPQL